MENNFSIEEIKNSVEYQWRKGNINQYLIIWLIVSIVTLIVPLIEITINLEFVWMGFLMWLIWSFFMGLLFGSLAFFEYRKNQYLLKNYKNFSIYEVLLDNFATSIGYKSCVYYKVKIDVFGCMKIVDTNPYFSDSIFSKFSPEDYNNKKVIGLYDEYKNKFYIIKLKNG